MKKQILASLFFASLSASAFALSVAEGGADRTNVHRVAESGSERSQSLRVAEGGSDRTKAFDVAENGSE
ncbi:hypothetical protein FUT48_25375, partial [Pseudomonas sp. JG-B]|nr:hypothetical protein [Pseudomonas sp. JG-B]